MIEPLKRFVKPTHAAETAGQGHVDHRQTGLMNELFGQQHPPRLRDGDRRRADVLAKQASKLSLADSEPIGQRGDIPRVERASFDQF